MEATADNEVMTGADEGELEDFAGSASDDADADTADEADQSANGHAGTGSHPRVPLPADEIGRSKSSSADSSASAGSVESPDSPKDDGDQPDDRAASSNGRVDSGRQAVRQAMAATNNWFTSRSGSGKSDSDPEPAAAAGAAGAATSDFSASSGFAPRDAKPSFTPSPQETTTTSAPSTTTTGRSLWRDAYASSQSAASSASSTSSAPSAGHSASSYTPPSSGFAGSGTGTSSSTTSDAPSGSSGFSSGTSLGGSGASFEGSGATLGSSGASLGGGGSAASQSAYASSVTAAWQRNSGTKRKRETSVRRSTRRQAQLTLARVEPWSVMKFSFVASVVAFIILFVGVAVLYMVLSALGVFDSLQHTVTTITSSQGSAGTNISNWFSASRILGYTGMLGALNIVLITAISTIGAVIYNLIARTIGGIEVTLRETE